MIKKFGNTLLLVTLLGMLLFGNLTESNVFQRFEGEKEVLFELNLTGSDFLSEIGADEFEIIDNSNYTYTGFRNMILILTCLIIGFLIIQFIDRSRILTPLLYSLMLIPAIFIGVSIAQYPNFFFELSLAKFPGINKIIDSKTPALYTIQYLAIIGLIFNWGIYLTNKKTLNKQSIHGNIEK